jgi:hypothetical protein
MKYQSLAMTAPGSGQFPGKWQRQTAKPVQPSYCANFSPLSSPSILKAKNFVCRPDRARRHYCKDV